MNRIQSVDFFRVAGIVGVMAIHTVPFENPAIPFGTRLDPAVVIKGISMFAVPMFFVLAGFFWAAKFSDSQSMAGPTLRMAGRLALLFVVWSLFYLLPTDAFVVPGGTHYSWSRAVRYKFHGILHDPFNGLCQGTKVHLWFLTGLLACLLISAAMLWRNMIGGLVVISILFYVFGLAGKAYIDTPMGFYRNFNLRNGPFFGLIFFVTGYLLQRKGPRASWLRWGLTLSAVGGLLQFVELYQLNAHYGTRMNQDYVVGTYFLGVGVALVALSDPPLFRARVVSSIGPLVLGIYAIHYAFVELLRPLDRAFKGNALWDVTYMAAVFMLSWLSVHGCSKVPILRRLVC